MRDENQLHAAVVELVALDDASIKYSTVQNWYPGDKNGVGGIYNFVTKRGACRGRRSKISWTQVETGSAITWKYPSCILQGDELRGRVLLGRDDEQPTAGRHRHEDDPHREEHHEHDHLEGHLGRAGPAVVSRSGEDRPQGTRARATTRSAIRCCSATSAGPTPSRTSRSRTRPQPSNTRRPPRRSARTSSSTAASAASPKRTPSR